jgi:hypothetical protein
MARLYANENFPLAVVQHLRQAGHDALTTNDTGKSGQKIADPEVLEYACADDRAVLTLNRKHFIRLHRNRPDHSGIIVCTVDHDSAALADRINEAVASEGSLMRKLLRVNRPSKPTTKPASKKRNST